jgi:hypothetical protein
VLKSDILSLAMDIPAVQKITYAPEIDEERDKKESEDDKRIPEELKQLAEKYGNDRPGKAQTTPLVMTQQI